MTPLYTNKKPEFELCHFHELMDQHIGNFQYKTNYYTWWNDQEVTKYNSHGLFPATRQESMRIRTSAENGEIIVFAIVVPDKNGVNKKLHIGNVSLQRIDLINRSAEFAVVIGEKDYWGNGYCTNASIHLFNHAFKKLNMHRLWSGTAQPNIGMQKVFDKLGMIQEGRFREATYLNGKYEDIVEYGILKDEWINR